MFYFYSILIFVVVNYEEEGISCSNLSMDNSITYVKHDHSFYNEFTIHTQSKQIQPSSTTCMFILLLYSY